jgi:hypothetical protein
MRWGVRIREGARMEGGALREGEEREAVVRWHGLCRVNYALCSGHPLHLTIISVFFGLKLKFTTRAPSSLAVQ